MVEKNQKSASGRGVGIDWEGAPGKFCRGNGNLLYLVRGWVTQVHAIFKTSKGILKIWVLYSIQIVHQKKNTLNKY